MAKVYLPQEGQTLPEEPKYLMLGTYGESFFTLKGELEAVLSAMRIEKVSYVADTTNPSYHPGRCAKISIRDIEVGTIGQVHPLVAKNYGIDTEVYCVQINLTALAEYKLPDPTYVPLPKYPAVSRDLSFICDESVTAAQAEATITKAAGKLLRSVRLFDIYRGTGIEEGKKSMAYALELRADDRTLTDTDSEQLIQKVLKNLKESLNADLR